jgi:cephalosporin hydroxylase
MIVEDTNLGHEVRQHQFPGPREAVHEFLQLPQGKNFRIDRRCEKYLMTFNPEGYLKYVGPK